LKIRWAFSCALTTRIKFVDSSDRVRSRQIGRIFVGVTRAGEAIRRPSGKKATAEAISNFRWKFQMEETADSKANPSISANVNPSPLKRVRDDSGGAFFRGV
jgi:hypothetical protein